MHWIISSVVLGGLALAAIGRPMKNGTWEGMLSYVGDECNLRVFTPREIWWVKGQRYTPIADDIRKQHAALTESPYDQVYARLRGKINKTKGQYGPLGNYHRVFYVSEILEIRPRRPGDGK